MFFLFLPISRRVGRVVECGSLENYCAVRYRGFESLTLRLIKPRKCEVFLFLNLGWYLIYILVLDE